MLGKLLDGHDVGVQPRFLSFSGSSLMTGACHHLSPASVVRDARYQTPKAFPSIAGAKIQKIEGGGNKFLSK